MRMSLVIPVFNEEDSIALCLTAVAQQSRPFDEVIVVDNGCTDDTMAIVETFRAQLPFVTLHEPVPGVGPARKAGLDAATGDVLCRIDADTRLDRHWARRAELTFDSESETSAVTGGLITHDSPIDGCQRAGLVKAAKKSLRSGTVDGATLAGCNMALRSDAWRSAQPHLKDAPRTHEDLDLHCALRTAGYSVRWQPAMVGAISWRRFAGPIRSNVEYLMCTIRTYRLHGDRRLVARQIAMVPVNLIFLLVARLLVGPFDPETRRWSLRRTRKSRISPVEGSRARAGTASGVESTVHRLRRSR